MDIRIIVALISVVVALISGAVSLYSAAAARRTEREKATMQQEIERLKSDLAEQQQIRTEQRTKREIDKQLLTKYRDPLLRSAFDLQSRLYNIVKQRFLKTYHKKDSYAQDNTLYVIAQYLAWVEIIRREVQFLDLGEEEQNKVLNEHMRGIGNAFRTDKVGPGSLRLFEGQQRAIGEIMITSRTDDSGKARHECIGYADFVTRLQEPEFAQWFNDLRTDIKTLASGGDDRRLIELQVRLIDLLDLLDKNKSRFPTEARTKLQHKVGPPEPKRQAQHRWRS